MKKYLNVLTLAGVLMSFCCSSFAQEAPKKINLENKKPVTNIKCEQKLPPMNAHHIRMPHQTRNAFAFFKFADELQLTDDQIIQLRGYYKKHFAPKAVKLEKPVRPSIEEFCNMTEEQMNNYAEAQANRVKTKIMSVLQKIIDIKKILSPEQLQKLKTMAMEAKKNSKKPETSKQNCEKVKFQNPGFCMPPVKADPHKMGGKPGMMKPMAPMCGHNMPGHNPCMMKPMAPMCGHNMPGHNPCMMRPMAPMCGHNMPGHNPCMMRPMAPMCGHNMPGHEPYMKNQNNKVGLRSEQNSSKMLEKQLINILKKYLSCQNDTKSGKIGINK